MSLLTLFRKMLFYWFMWKFRGDCSWAKASLNRSVSICQWRLQHPRRIKAIIFKMVTTYVHYIRTLHTYTTYVHYIRTLYTYTIYVHYVRTLYWEDYLSLGLVWQSKLQLLIYLQVNREKVLSLFFFCYYGSKLLQNSPFFLNATNYRRIPCLIEDLNSLQ